MDSGNKPTLTREQIVAGLCGLGLATMDLVQVHSSLSALGQVVGGADAVVDALLEVVGLDCPLGRWARLGGKILLLGIDDQGAHPASRRRHPR